ncbi:hypothetical protein Hamer_G013939, partial [Homarus americanus]
NTEKFDSLLSLLIPEETSTEETDAEESKSKKTIQEKKAEIAGDMKETLKETQEIRELQTKCEQYESERRRMRAMADSSCSPFVFSPLSELSPDPPSVPDLAPLEMPPLDFMENYEKDS